MTIVRKRVRVAGCGLRVARVRVRACVRVCVCEVVGSASMTVNSAFVLSTDLWVEGTGVASLWTAVSRSRPG